MEQHEPHQPTLYQEAADIKAARPAPADSPPPNCAICLGTCTNKCFTNCCMHQFCFNCLLEWSKIKAECPLCKQPFKSIIYNIKSNLEYEEHIITNPERAAQGEELLLDEDVHTEYLFLPNGPRPQRHFQFRTTLTLDPGGEFAIQQLLLSHPRTNSLYLQERYHHRIPQQTINFRRAVYHNGWWVNAQPDITGRYRDCTPNFFRENPAQTHRIIPWLNRELNALVVEYNEIYIVQEHIMEMLCQYPIQSASFRTRIVNFLGSRTDQFIHEFYNFVRSPFDMIGYDRHVSYSQQRPLLISPQSLSDDEDDSDVRVVDSPNDCIYVPPRTPEVIVINSDSDSDVIIRSPLPPPPTPPTVDLLDSDSDSNINVTTDPPTIESEREETRSPQLPIKIRLKINRNHINTEMCKFKQKEGHTYRLAYDSDSNHPKSESEYSTAHISTSGNCSSSSDENEIKNSWTTSIREDYKYVQTLILKQSKSKQKRKRKTESKNSRVLKKTRSKKIKYDSDEPLDRLCTKRKKSKKSSKSKKAKREKRKRIKMERSNSSSRSSHHSDSAPNSSGNDDGKEDLPKEAKHTFDNVKLENSYSSEVTNYSQSSAPDTLPATEDVCEKPEDLSKPGPSQSLRSVIVKGNNMWYSRPDLEDASSDNNSD